MKKKFYLEIERCEQCPMYFRQFGMLGHSWKKECMQKGNKEISMDESIPDWCPLEEVEVTLPDENCYICNTKIDNLSGNPSKWGVALPYPKGEGKRRYYHMDCLVPIIERSLEGEK